MHLVYCFVEEKHDIERKSVPCSMKFSNIMIMFVLNLVFEFIGRILMTPKCTVFVLNSLLSENSYEIAVAQIAEAKFVGNNMRNNLTYMETHWHNTL